MSKIFQDFKVLPYWDSDREKYYDMLDFDEWFNDNYIDDELISIQMVDYSKNEDTVEYMFWYK